MTDRPILLDVSRLIWRWWGRRLPTGIDRVCLAYLDHYGHAALAVVQFRGWRLILNRRSSRDLFRLLRDPHRRFRTRLAIILAGALLRRRTPNQSAIYLNVGHTGLNSVQLVAWLRRQQLLPIYLVHDLIPITHPQYCRAGEAERHAQRITNALESAAGIVVNSAVTAEDLAEFAHDIGCPMPPIEVAWLGIARRSLPVRTQAQRPYFVALGTIEARKNHQLLLDIWARLVADQGDAAPELVIVGQRGWEAQSIFDQLDQPGPVAGNVRELGRCDDSTLQSLMAGARALLMPSFAEGFGLPVVEALEQGTPVIASDLAVFREIAGNIPDYAEPDNLERWSDLVAEYAGDGPARVGQLARMAGFRAPSWDEHFRRVDRFIQRLDPSNR